MMPSINALPSNYFKKISALNFSFYKAKGSFKKPSKDSLELDHNILGRQRPTVSAKPGCAKQTPAWSINSYSAHSENLPSSRSMRQIIIHSNFLEELSQLATPDAFDATDIMLRDDRYSTVTCEPLSVGRFFEGLTQLATTGVVEMTEIVAAIHCEVMLRPIGCFDNDHVENWRYGIVGRIYSGVRYLIRQVGNNMGAILQLYSDFSQHEKIKPIPDSLKLFVNALNGIMGDHLVRLNNLLAIPMALYNKDGQPQYDELSGRIVILVHGLCMSHLSWNPCDEDSFGEHILKAEPDTTVLYLDYNTGQRISKNGHDLNSLLQQLVNKNPNITQIDLVGHSMGGLVCRSALFYAELERLNWLDRCCILITLGSPHHGAVLERIGFYAQDVISKLPFAGSLAKLGDVRSAGIFDLRHGNIRDEDWNSHDDRNGRIEDVRHPTDLPNHIKAYFAASTLEDGLSPYKASSIIGDGLVAIDSALGEHAGDYKLFVPEGHKAIFYGVNHIELQYNVRVREQVVAWITGKGQDALDPRIYSYPDETPEVIRDLSSSPKKAIA